jgi:predicted metal-dependent phosphoesterase TrpH
MWYLNNLIMIDLHIHTSHSSDGQYRPEEIFEIAVEKGVHVISFTDHMDSAAAAEGLYLAQRYNIEFFTGVEISTSMDGREYHLLLYGFNPDDPYLHEFLSQNCQRIWKQAHDLVEHFQNMGFDITREDIAAWGKSVPTGVTFLDALKKRNAHDERLFDYLYGEKSSSPYLNFYQDFSLTGFGRIISRVMPSLEKTVIRFKDRGVLILAHPGMIAAEDLVKLSKCGLDGIEVYSSHHTYEETVHLASLSRSMGIFASAGSDFHGERIKPDIAFGDIAGQPDEGLVRALRRRA